MAVLTDSLSNIMSLASPGNRDSAEAEIRRAIRRACDRGVRIRIQHCKGHSGVLGNDLADVWAGDARVETAGVGGARKVSRRVACKLSALAAREGAKQNWESKALGGTTARCRLLAALRIRGGGVMGNPLLKKGMRGLEERRWEVAFNHLRMGRVAGVWCERGRVLTRTWKCGCERGAGEDGVLHFLFKCPSVATQREVMREEVRMREEVEARERRRAGRDLRVSAWGQWCILQRHPGAVMRLLKGAKLGGGDCEEVVSDVGVEPSDGWGWTLGLVGGCSPDGELK